MPYASKDEANPSLKGIEPPLTLAQMNMVAGWADAIEGDKGWPIAIAQFKDRYEPNDTKTGWRKKQRTEEGFMPDRIFSLAEADEMAEAATQKARAQRALIALRAVLEDKTTPKDIMEQVTHLIAAMRKKWKDLEDEAGDAVVPPKGKGKSKEDYYGDEQGGYLPMTTMSFADLEAQKQSQEYAENLRQRTREFNDLATNVLYTPAIEDGERAGKLRALVEEFIAVLALEPEMPATEVEESDHLRERLAEAEGSILGLSQADPVEWENDGAKPLMIEVVPIEPGWGNTRDNHHYSAEMLRKNANIFEGAMMYASEHDPKTKSVLTAVSQIVKSPIRFLPSGAPVALAAIYDRDFQFSVREREKAGKLSDLQCSILAEGEVQEGFTEGDRTGKDVLRFTEMQSIDWVMRAGAGGRALKLAENEKGVDGMAIKDETKDEVVVEGQAPETKVEVLHEGDAPTMQTILEAILTSDLPKPVGVRLARGQYATPVALQEAIQEAAAEVVAIRGDEPVAAAPAAFGLSTDEQRQEEAAPSERTDAQIAEAQTAILAQYLPNV